MSTREAMPTAQEKQKKPIDEAVLRRLAEGRLKGLETRRKKSEIKKQEKAEAVSKLNKEYEEKVLKKKEPVEQSLNETDEEIYKGANNVNNDNDEYDSESETESEVTVPVKKITRKPKAAVSHDAPNYKQ